MADGKLEKDREGENGDWRIGGGDGEGEWGMEGRKRRGEKRRELGG